MLALQPKHLKMLQKIFEQHIPDMTVWAFGSRVRETSHEGSDLDLVVINLKKPTEPQVHFDVLKDAIRQSNLPMLVDILDWARIPLSFQEEIKKNYFLIKSS